MTLSSVRELLATISEEGNRATFTVTEDWLQGRTIYGGLIVLLGQTLMARKVIGDRHLRSLNVVFAAPNAVGNITFVTDVLREGKSVTVIRSDIISNGAISTTLTGTYGAERQSKVYVPVKPLELGHLSTGAAKQLEPNDFLPPYYSHFEIGVIGDNFPFTNSKISSWSALVRYRGEEDSQMTMAHMLGLLDVLPTPAIAMLDGVYPASTLTWTVDILDEKTNFEMSDWWRIDMKVDACANGYSVYTAHVINPAGKVAAISRQVTAIFG